MDYSQLSSKQQDCRDWWTAFAAKYLRAHGAEADRLGDIPGHLLGNKEFLQAMPLFLPTAMGGGWRNTSLFDSLSLRVAINEEAGYYDSSLFLSMPGPGLTVPLVCSVADSEQKERFCSRFTETDSPHWAAFALTEPSAGSDVAALQTTARKERHGFVLNGRKWFIGNGRRADWVIVFANINASLGRFGIRAFFLEQNTPGFKATRLLASHGLRALQVSELSFEECWIPENNLLVPPKGGLRNGFDFAVSTLKQFRPTIAAVAIGAARALLDEVEILVQQDGSTHFLAHRWNAARDRVSQLRLKIIGARLLCMKAAELADRNEDNFSQVCMAKAYAPQVALAVCDLVADIIGPQSAYVGALFERFTRDLRAFDILEGMGTMHKLMLTRTLIRHAAPGLTTR